jgi:hypothetical protein
VIESVFDVESVDETDWTTSLEEEETLLVDELGTAPITNGKGRKEKKFSVV